MQKNDSSFSPLTWVLIFIGLVVLSIIARRLAFVFFMVFVFLVFVGSIYFIVKHFQDAKREQKFQNSMLGSIAQNLKLCNDQIQKNEAEMADIQENILELKEKLDDKMSINETSMRESDLLINGFEREMDLRKAKLDFYKICKDKLHNIDFNQKLSEEIASKKERLKQLQEEHFEDLAEMEQLRSDMEYNKSYIDTINNLSIRMAESTSLSTAQELHNELKLIVKELKGL